MPEFTVSLVKQVFEAKQGRLALEPSRVVLGSASHRYTVGRRPLNEVWSTPLLGTTTPFRTSPFTRVSKTLTSGD